MFDFLKHKKAEGFVKRIGFSFHDTADVLDEFLSQHPEVDFVQIQLNYLDWESVVIQSHKCYETAVRHGKPVIVMEPVKGGTLAGLPTEAESLLRSCNPDMSIASWAIRFAASQENVMMVLSGISNFLTTASHIADKIIIKIFHTTAGKLRFKVFIKFFFLLNQYQRHLICQQER